MARAPTTSDVFNAVADIHRREILDALMPARCRAPLRAYDEHPLDEPDEWGDLASFRRAAAAS